MIWLWILMAATNQLMPLWLTVIVGGALSLAMTALMVWQQKGAATKDELHEEVGGLEQRVNRKFEQERQTARDANAKIYNRLNDAAKGVTRVETKMEGLENMLSRLVDKELQD